MLYITQSSNDVFFYGILIVGAILFVGLMMKLLGVVENNNDMNTDYVDDDEFMQYDDDDLFGDDD